MFKKNYIYTSNVYQLKYLQYHEIPNTCHGQGARFQGTIDIAYAICRGIKIDMHRLHEV